MGMVKIQLGSTILIDSNDDGVFTYSDDVALDAKSQIELTVTQAEQRAIEEWNLPSFDYLDLKSLVQPADHYVFQYKRFYKQTQEASMSLGFLPTAPATTAPTARTLPKGGPAAVLTAIAGGLILWWGTRESQPEEIEPDVVLDPQETSYIIYASGEDGEIDETDEPEAPAPIDSDVDEASEDSGELLVEFTEPATGEIETLDLNDLNAVSDKIKAFESLVFQNRQRVAEIDEQILSGALEWEDAIPLFRKLLETNQSISEALDQIRNKTRSEGGDHELTIGAYTHTSKQQVTTLDLTFDLIVNAKTYEAARPFIKQVTAPKSKTLGDCLKSLGNEILGILGELDRYMDVTVEVNYDNVPENPFDGDPDIDWIELYFALLGPGINAAKYAKSKIEVYYDPDLKAIVFKNDYDTSIVDEDRIGEAGYRGEHSAEIPTQGGLGTTELDLRVVRNEWTTRSTFEDGEAEVVLFLEGEDSVDTADLDGEDEVQTERTEPQSLEDFLRESLTEEQFRILELYRAGKEEEAVALLKSREPRTEPPNQDWDHLTLSDWFEWIVFEAQRLSQDDKALFIALDTIDDFLETRHQLANQPVVGNAPQDRFSSLDVFASRGIAGKNNFHQFFDLEVHLHHHALSPSAIRFRYEYPELSEQLSTAESNGEAYPTHLDDLFTAYQVMAGYSDLIDVSDPYALTK